MEALKQAQQSELMVRADVDNYRKRMDQEIKRKNIHCTTVH